MNRTRIGAGLLLLLFACGGGVYFVFFHGAERGAICESSSDCGRNLHCAQAANEPHARCRVPCESDRDCDDGDCLVVRIDGRDANIAACDR
ncbi:MAG: hypothetical protein AAGE52_15165 [Myxococcota bacterium]